MRAVEWKTALGLVDYEHAVTAMEHRVAAIRAGAAPELVWLLEHPPLYTAGASAKAEDLREPGMFPVYTTGRGGRYTYHGPGQRIAYTMIDLKRRCCDVRAYVYSLEDWVIATLAQFNLRAVRRPERVGIWVERRDGGEDKIAAIGVRVRRWVSYHGLSLNVAPNLDHYRGIVPCGITGYGMTSLAELGIAASLVEVDAALKVAFDQVFGDTSIAIDQAAGATAGRV